LREREKVLQQYPDSRTALDEAITVELKAGQSLLIPSFTWVQVEWTEMGFAVSHVGWVSTLNEDQLSAVTSMNYVWKQFLFCFNNLSDVDITHIALRYLSLGRCRGLFSGGVVRAFSILYPFELDFSNSLFLFLSFSCTTLFPSVTPFLAWFMERNVMLVHHPQKF
jgi:hypothetical protein